MIIQTLTKEQISKCMLIAAKRCKSPYSDENVGNSHYEWTENSYREGKYNSKDDPFKTERFGVYGEMFVHLAFPFLGEIDDTPLEDGDRGFDFSYNEYSFDAKFQVLKVSSCRYGQFYIKATDKNGKLKTDLPSDIYIFTSFLKAVKGDMVLHVDNPKAVKFFKTRAKADMKAEKITGIIHGFITKEEVLSQPLVWSRTQPTMYRDPREPDARNFYIKESELHPIEEFLEYVSIPRRQREIKKTYY